MSSPEPPEKNKGGRPQKTLTDLPTEWRAMVLKDMEEGASKAEVRALLCVSKSLFNRWMEDYEEFRETIEEGENRAQAWWERQGRTNLQNRSFNYVGWFMNMRNRFGWSNNQDLPQDANPPAQARPRQCMDLGGQKVYFD